VYDIDPALLSFSWNSITRTIYVPVVGVGTLTFQYGTSPITYTFASGGVYSITFSASYNVITSVTKVSSLPTNVPYFTQLYPATANIVGVTSTVQSSSCTFYVSWGGSNLLGGYIFGTNQTGHWENQTWNNTATGWGGTGYEAWGNYTATLNDTVSLVVGWREWCNDSRELWGDTGILTFIITRTPLFWNHTATESFTPQQTDTVSKTVQSSASLTYTSLLHQTSAFNVLSNVLESFSSSISKTVTEAMTKSSAFTFSSILTKTASFSHSYSSTLSFSDSFRSTFALLSNVGNVLLAFMGNIGKALSFQSKPQATLAYADSFSKTISFSKPLSASLTFNADASKFVSSRLLTWISSGLLSFFGNVGKTMGVQAKPQAPFTYTATSFRGWSFSIKPLVSASFVDIVKTLWGILPKPQATFSFTDGFTKTMSFNTLPSATLAFVTQAVYVKLMAGYTWLVSGLLSFASSLSKSVNVASNPQVSIGYTDTTIAAWNFPIKPIVSVSFVDIGKALWTLAPKPQSTIGFTNQFTKTFSFSTFPSSTLAYSDVAKWTVGAQFVSWVSSSILSFSGSLTKIMTTSLYPASALSFSGPANNWIIAPDWSVSFGWLFNGLTTSPLATATFSFTSSLTASLTFVPSSVAATFLRLSNWLGTATLSFTDSMSNLFSFQATPQVTLAFTATSKTMIGTFLSWTGSSALSFVDALTKTVTAHFASSSFLSFQTSMSHTGLVLPTFLTWFGSAFINFIINAAPSSATLSLSNLGGLLGLSQADVMAFMFLILMLGFVGVVSFTVVARRKRKVEGEE
jgi:hypothetical protein